MCQWTRLHGGETVNNFLLVVVESFLDDIDFQDVTEVTQ